MTGRNRELLGESHFVTKTWKNFAFALTCLFLKILICAFPICFTSNLFVQVIKYNPELHFYPTNVPIKDDLSPQEANLSVGSEKDEPTLGM